MKNRRNVFKAIAQPHTSIEVIATKLWKKLWGLFWDGCEDIHRLLSVNKMFKLQLLLYGMFILNNYKCSPQVNFFTWRLFWIFPRFSMDKRGERGKFWPCWYPHVDTHTLVPTWCYPHDGTHVMVPTYCYPHVGIHIPHVGI